jgi:hypothetical protein
MADFFGLAHRLLYAHQGTVPDCGRDDLGLNLNCEAPGMRNSLLSTTAAAGLAAAFAMLAAPTGATAGVQHESFGPVKITTSGGQFLSTPLAIPTFNTNLGTLQSVLVVEHLHADYRGTANLSASGNHSLTFSGNLKLTTALAIAGKPGVLDGTPVFAVGGGEFISVKPGSSTPYTSLNNTTAHGPFKYTKSSSTTALGNWETVGPGSVTASISTLTAPTTNTPSGLTINPLSSNLTFTLKGTYTYTTPEPASALMLGAGLIALGAARRRGKRKPVQG